MSHRRRGAAAAAVSSCAATLEKFLHLGTAPLGQKPAETAQQLRLRPPVHRNIVPAEEELPGPKAAARLLPPKQDVVHDAIPARLRVRGGLASEREDIDRLRVVVQLTRVEGEAGSARERARQSLGIEEMLRVIAQSGADRGAAQRAVR